MFYFWIPSFCGKARLINEEKTKWAILVVILAAFFNVQFILHNFRLWVILWYINTEREPRWLYSLRCQFPKFPKLWLTQRRSPHFSWAGDHIFPASDNRCSTGNRRLCSMFSVWPSHSSLLSSASWSIDSKLPFTITAGNFIADRGLFWSNWICCAGCAKSRLPGDCFNIWSWPWFCEVYF